MPTKKLGLFLTGLTFGVLLTGVFFLGGFLDRLGFLKIIDRWLPFSGFGPEQGYLEQKVLREESVIIDVAEKAAASAVTVSINKTERVPLFDFDPFGFFNFQTQERKIEQDIGSGFIVDGGLVVTNKHVVSDTSAKYKVIDKDDHILEVKDIYRDPANDLAILKVETQLPALELGNSEDLKVGQLVIAIGTALGKFRHTVTTGVISGLGRGITAGSAFEGYAEQLDNVIQTDAAINPGNSGGPLLDSSGKVIGVNVAIAGGAQNIGFAIPIDVVRESLKLFKETGEFNRPFFGVEYQMISEKAAILNEVPQGAYIRRVVSGSAAEEAGLKEGDIVTYIDGERLEGDESNLVKIVNRKKVGDKVEIKYWRDGQTVSVTVRLTTKNEG
ncbi:MAG: trypsin-like peptidase domain-containing protein [Patescibacteria group bacterium]